MAGKTEITRERDACGDPEFSIWNDGDKVAVLAFVPGCGWLLQVRDEQMSTFRLEATGYTEVTEARFGQDQLVSSKLIEK